MYVAGGELLNSQIAFAGIDVTFVQSPNWPSHRHFGSQTGEGSYLDLLVHIGFADPLKLGSVVTGWLSLLDFIKPDVVVADHSPALLVACRIKAIPVVLAGTCFSLPPLELGRFPPMKADRAPVMPEARVLQSIATVMQAHGANPPATLIDLFRTRGRFVFGMQELDPYAPFRREPVCLPPENLAAFVEPPVAPRIFLYLGMDVPGIDDFIQTVVALNIPIEAYLGRDIAPLGRFLALAGHIVHESPPPFGEVMPRASHIVSESGVYTCMNAMSAGRPLLGLVPHGEAEFNISVLEKLGMGQKLEKSIDEQKLSKTLIGFIKDHALQQRARHWAKVLEARNGLARRGAPAVIESIKSILA